MSTAHLDKLVVENTLPSRSDRTEGRYGDFLAALVLIGLVLSMPFSAQMAAVRPHYQPTSNWVLAFGIAVQTVLIYLVILLGLKLGPAVGLGWPPLLGGTTERGPRGERSVL